MSKIPRANRAINKINPSVKFILKLRDSINKYDKIIDDISNESDRRDCKQRYILRIFVHTFLNVLINTKNH